VLSYIIRQLSGGVMVFVRAIKSVLMRSVAGVRSSARRVTNVSRATSKAANKATQNISKIGQKPTKREDFIETKNSYIAKSFVIGAVIVLVLLALLVYFVIYPLVVRYFFTARLQKDSSKLERYTGKVITFYDKNKTIPNSSGYMKDGKMQGTVKQYDTDGELVYEGEFNNDMRSGEGSEYEDGKLRYRGNFENGEYNGKGELYEDGLLAYTGTFKDGQLDGSNCCAYYPNGVAAYRGEYSRGERTGEGAEYYKSGAPEYIGEFVRGIWTGDGTLYDEDGNTLYVGSFKDGLYDGEGTLYLPGDFRLSGSFQQGVQSGQAQISRNGLTYYDGACTDGEAHGKGQVYDRLGNLLYDGTMRGNTIDGSCLLGMTMDEVKEALGDSRFTETEQANGILFSANELNLYVYFSYGVEEDGDPVAFDVCLCANGGYDADLETFLWSFSDDLDGWRDGLWPNADIIAGEAVPQFAAQKYDGNAYPCIIFPDGYGDCIVWMNNGECFMLQWTVAEGQVAEASDFVYEEEPELPEGPVTE